MVAQRSRRAEAATWKVRLAMDAAEADPDGEEGGDDQLADDEGLLVLLDVA